MLSLTINSSSTSVLSFSTTTNFKPSSAINFIKPNMTGWWKDGKDSKGYVAAIQEEKSGITILQIIIFF